MEYRREGNLIALRLDRGEKLVESLQSLALREGIRTGSVTGIGGIGTFTTGVFDRELGQYRREEHHGLFEVDSITGNITTSGGEPYLHLHIVASTYDGVTVGGHLFEAEIALTAELFVTVMEGVIGRKRDEELKINTWNFREEKE